MYHGRPLVVRRLRARPRGGVTVVSRTGRYRTTRKPKGFVPGHPPDRIAAAARQNREAAAWCGRQVAIDGLGGTCNANEELKIY